MTHEKQEGATVPRDVLDVAIEAARRAGAELSGRYGRPASGVGAKQGPTDLVSDADRAAEAAIAAVLLKRRPGDGVLGEEGTANRDGTSGLRWVVDPLDGTMNYLLGIPLWCVSIACEDAAGTLAGVVYDPLRNELFSAVRGGPARIDGPQPADARAPRSRRGRRHRRRRLRDGSGGRARRQARQAAVPAPGPAPRARHAPRWSSRGRRPGASTSVTTSSASTRGTSMPACSSASAPVSACTGWHR
jgi:myo-inositol-1(or 4)-monophosphatase